MSNYDLHQIYKDLYYHELDVREKITNRLQITFAFHATILTVLAYMARMIDYASLKFLLGIVYFSLFVSVGLLAKSIFETINAFWGNTYKSLATANEIESYRKKYLDYKDQLEDYKKNNPDQEIKEYSAETKINDYLYLEFSKCASHNFEVNDVRSKRIHKATKYLLLFCIPFLVASVCFTVFDMDASSPRKKILLEYQGIVKSIDELPVISQSEIISSFKSILEKNHQEIIASYTTVSENNNKELNKAIGSASKIIANALKQLQPLIKEKVMPEEEKQPEKEQPTPPAPPERRDLIESQHPDIKTQKWENAMSDDDDKKEPPKEPDPPPTRLIKDTSGEKDKDKK